MIFVIKTLAGKSLPNNVRKKQDKNWRAHRILRHTVTWLGVKPVITSLVYSSGFFKQAHKLPQSEYILQNFQWQILLLNYGVKNWVRKDPLHNLFWPFCWDVVQWVIMTFLRNLEPCCAEWQYSYAWWYIYTRMVSAFVRMHITHCFTCHLMTSWILSQSENTQKSENCRSNVILKWCLLKNLNLKVCVSCEQLRRVGVQPCLRNLLEKWKSYHEICRV